MQNLDAAPEFQLFSYLEFEHGLKQMGLSELRDTAPTNFSCRN